MNKAEAIFARSDTTRSYSDGVRDFHSPLNVFVILAACAAVVMASISSIQCGGVIITSLPIEISRAANEVVSGHVSSSSYRPYQTPDALSSRGSFLQSSLNSVIEPFDGTTLFS